MDHNRQIVALYGREEPLPDAITLRAGALTMRFEDGELRDIRLGRLLLLSRVYAAVRDRNWGTVGGVMTLQELEIEPDRFRITFEMEHRTQEIDFAWQGAVTGGADSSVVFRFDGMARAQFERNRIGFCVLHPAEFAGLPCTVTRIDGASISADLPIRVRPEQPLAPFEAMASLETRFPDGSALHVGFHGDTFEMEDQRNWTDASFKTFCTPLALPFPVTVLKGAEVRQRVEIGVANAPIRSSSAAPVGPIALREAGGSTPLPAIGLCAPRDLNVPWSEEIRDGIALAGPRHLRIDLDLFDAGWEERLVRGLEIANQISVPIELALRVQDAQPLAALTRALEGYSAPIARVLLLPDRESPGLDPDHTSRASAVRAQFADRLSAVPLFVGTNTDFLFLNRYPPAAESCDGLAFSINPQVHAFDAESLMETLPMQAVVAESAQSLWKVHDGRAARIAIGPITLLPRWNPYGSSPALPTASPADPRRRGLFGAAWTLGSLIQLATSGAESLTYFETHGPAGLLEGEAVFPLYHSVADLLEFAGGEAIRCESGEPSKITAIALTHANRMRLLIANLTPEPQSVQLDSAWIGSSVRVLDIETVSLATGAPDRFRAFGRRLEDPIIEIGPFATACFDRPAASMP